MPEIKEHTKSDIDKIKKNYDLAKELKKKSNHTNSLEKISGLYFETYYLYKKIKEDMYKNSPQMVKLFGGMRQDTRGDTGLLDKEAKKDLEKKEILDEIELKLGKLFELYKDELTEKFQQTLNEALKTISGPNPDIQSEVLPEIKRLYKIFQFQVKNPGVDPLPEVNDDSYELYKSRTNPYIHLRDNWGRWLVHFNGYFQSEFGRPPIKRDYLSQEMLGKYDLKFLTALKNASKRKTLVDESDTSLKLADIVPPDKILKQAEYAEYTLEEVREAQRIVNGVSKLNSNKASLS